MSAGIAIIPTVESAIEIPSALSGAFRARAREANKYTVGTVAVIGGSERFPHAPVFAALGARTAGAGLIRLVIPEASRFAAAQHVPEATLARLGEEELPPRADVCVAGMGLGLSASTEAVVRRLLLGGEGRFVIDADALTVLAGRGGLERQEGRSLVLTPHEGEAARLLGTSGAQVRADRLSAARELAARYGATVVLKGPGTLVVSADGRRVYENAAGNPYMALGGMGDLLAGVIGARWAYLGPDAFLAAAGGVWLHSLASDRVVAAGKDPSVVGTAAELGGVRVRLDSGCASEGRV